MKRTMFVSLPLAFLLAAGLSQAATVRNYSGTECDAIEPEHNDYIGRNNEGCINSTSQCGTAAGVVLPISGNNSTTVIFNHITLSYYDGTSLDNIVCTPAARNASGTTFSGDSLTTSGTGYGTLVWTDASGTDNTPNSGGSFSNVAVQHIYCYIPSEKFGIDCTDGGNKSSILSYSVEVNAS